MRKIKIVGTGSYLPQKNVASEELAKQLGVTKDEVIAKSGVYNRRYVSDGETASKMGAMAAKNALDRANLTVSDIDLIICASGSMEMPIPCTASLIHKELGLKDSSTPAFDINSTCLSFVTALDMISHLIDIGKYQRVLIVSTEIASAGLNQHNIEVASLFGDGAAACIVERSSEKEESGILGSAMNTYSKGSSWCTIPGGGSAYPPQHWTLKTAEHFQFHMSGREVFRLASQLLPDFVQKLLTSCEMSLDDIDVIVPHQASQSGIRIVGKKLNFPTEKIVNIIADHGNMIAASIPLALHLAIEKKQIKRGQRIMLLGTSAGLSIGGIILTY